MGNHSYIQLRSCQWWNLRLMHLDHGAVVHGLVGAGFRSPGTGLSIAAKEIIPIVLSWEAWGSQWYGCRVLCRCDNQVAVTVLRMRTSRDTGMCHLLKCLIFMEATLGCHLSGEYIDTRSNHLVDDQGPDGRPMPHTTIPATARPVAPSSGRLGLERLAPSLHKYFQEGLALLTQEDIHGCYE